MVERFYVNSPLGPGPVELTGPEAHHLAAVRRLHPGAAVCLFNGDGREYPALVAEVGRRHVALTVTGVETPDRELPFRLEVAAPLPKGDRAQFLVEKLTELGVTAYTPLQTARSVVHPREAKLDKLQRYVIEASKQCGRNVLMEVRPPTPWGELLARPDLPALRIVAHPVEIMASGGRESPARPAGAILRNERRDCVLAVGPEGGFTDDEVQQATAAGWQLVDLGRRVLRVETAAVVLAALAACGGAATPAAAP